MKRNLRNLLLSFAISFPVYAVLPPLYQTAKEIDALVTSEELGRFLTSADVIMRIDKIDTGYLITTNKHRLYVDVIALPQQQPGPVRFTLHFNPALPL